MKLTITNFLFLTAVAWLPCACGSFNTDQIFTVDMYGVSKAPEGATGARDPKFQSYELLKVDFISEDGTTPTNLFDGEEKKVFRIVDREQQILSKEISELEGLAFGSIHLTFAPLVTSTESGKELQFTLSSPTLSLTQAFAVEKAKNLTLLIRISWGNTLSEDGMSEPQYNLSLD